MEQERLAEAKRVMAAEQAELVALVDADPAAWPASRVVQASNEIARRFCEAIGVPFVVRGAVRSGDGPG